MLRTRLIFASSSTAAAVILFIASTAALPHTLVLLVRTDEEMSDSDSQSYLPLVVPMLFLMCGPVIYRGTRTERLVALSLALLILAIEFAIFQLPTGMLRIPRWWSARPPIIPTDVADAMVADGKAHLASPTDAYDALSQCVRRLDARLANCTPCRCGGVAERYRAVFTASRDALDTLGSLPLAFACATYHVRSEIATYAWTRYSCPGSDGASTKAVCESSPPRDGPLPAAISSLSALRLPPALCARWLSSYAPPPRIREHGINDNTGFASGYDYHPFGLYLAQLVRRHERSFASLVDAAFPSAACGNTERSTVHYHKGFVAPTRCGKMLSQIYPASCVHLMGVHTLIAELTRTQFSTTAPATAFPTILLQTGIVRNYTFSTGHGFGHGLYARYRDLGVALDECTWPGSGSFFATAPWQGTASHGNGYAVFHRACLNGVVHGHFNALPAPTFARATVLDEEVNRCRQVLRRYDLRLSTRSCEQYMSYARALLARQRVASAIKCE